MQFKSVQTVGVAVGLAMGLAAAGSAAADTVTGAGFYPTESITYEGTINNAGSGPFTRLTGPIQLNFDGSQTPVWVFCVDWNHNVGVGLGYQAAVDYTYNLAPVKTDSTGVLSGTGLPLSETVSGEIQTLVNLGVAAANSGAASDDQLAAFQAAIWDIEYGLTQNAGDASASEIATINADIAYAQANPSNSYALAFYDPAGGSQALATTVPEPTTWALMLVGFGGLGGALRARRKAVAA
jgi:hypothetical protein